MRSPWIMVLAALCAIVPVGAASFDVPPDATSSRPFEQWLAELLVEARERGYSDELLATTLGGVQPLPGVLDNDRAQPEAKLTFEDYVSRRLTPDTVLRGRVVYDNYDALLRYNCAHHYALSVALLADRIR